MTEGKKITLGLFWTLTEKFGSRIFTLIIFFYLARQLGPTAFGVVAVASSIMAFLQIFVEQGLTQALVQKKETDATAQNSAFLGGLALSVLLYALLYASAVPLARLFEEPALVGPLRVMGLVMPLSSLGIVPIASLQREMNFRPLALRQLLGVLVGGAIGISLALADYGVWALVWYQVAVGAAANLTVLVASDWRPRWAFSRTAYRELLDFSINLVGNRLIFFGSAHLINLLVGYFLGMDAAGIYSIAKKVGKTFQDLVVNSFSNVYFTAVSRHQANAKRLRELVEGFGSLAALGVTAAFLLAAANVPLFVSLFFGPEWRSAVPLIQIGFAFASVGFLNSFVNDTFVGLGYARLSFRLQFVGFVLLMLLVGPLMQYGLVYVAWARAIQSVVMLGIRIFVLWRSKLIDNRALPPIAYISLITYVVFGVAYGAAVLLTATDSWYQLVLNVVLFLLLIVPTVRVFNDALWYKTVNIVKRQSKVIS